MDKARITPTARARMSAPDAVATRYAEALFELAKPEQRIEEISEQLAGIRQLIEAEAGLRELLLNPDVEPEQKLGVLTRLLGAGWSDLLEAFVRMLLSLGRGEYLGQIAQAFQALVDVDQGRLRVTVRSARPVPEPTLAKLREGLERREHKHIELDTELVPELLGGIQLVLGHRVIDSSVRRQLTELRQRLRSVRVY